MGEWSRRVLRHGRIKISYRDSYFTSVYSTFKPLYHFIIACWQLIKLLHYFNAFNQTTVDLKQFSSITKI